MLESTPTQTGHINFKMKPTRKPDAGNPLVRFGVEGTENGSTVELRTHLAIERASVEILGLNSTRQSSTLSAPKSNQLSDLMYVSDSFASSVRM